MFNSKMGLFRYDISQNKGVANPPSPLISKSKNSTYIIDLVMVHQFYSDLTSNHQPKISNQLKLLVPDWLFASILL